MTFKHYWESIEDYRRSKLSIIKVAMEQMIAKGCGQTRIAAELNRLRITTIMGTSWNQPKVSQYMKRLGLKTKFMV